MNMRSYKYKITHFKDKRSYHRLIFKGDPCTWQGSRQIEMGPWLLMLYLVFNQNRWTYFAMRKTYSFQYVSFLCH